MRGWLIQIATILAVCIVQGDTAGYGTAWRESISKVVADPTYMKECRAINPKTADRQIAYRGILPGTTTTDAALQILGSPTDTYSFGGTTWYYDDGITLAIGAGTVREVYPAHSELRLSLRDYVLEVGCPDVILRNDPSNGGEAYLGAVVVIWPASGLALRYEWARRIGLDDLPGSVVFQTPQGIDEFLARDIVFDLGIGIPVPWRTIVR